MDVTNGTRRIKKGSKPAGLLAVALICAAPCAVSAAPSSVLNQRDDFNAGAMLRPGPAAQDAGASFSLAQPGRFSMRQSYSLSAMSGPGGSMSSGLYLNTLSYRLAAPLTAFVDVGFHTPLHSTLPGEGAAAGAGSLVLPRMGLVYRPSERLTMNIELVNGPDAWKAYGGMPGFSSAHDGSGIP